MVKDKDYIVLNNGIEMPLIGLGSYRLNGIKMLFFIRKAVKHGYRNFDLAPAYGNERWFGRCIPFCGRRRKNLFITTKLSNRGQETGDVRSQLLASLKRLSVKYLDLYLMHWPVPDLYVSSWKQMESLYKEGLVRAIGVCNFHKHHMENLLKYAEVIPAINQIELHPLLSQLPLRQYCEEKGIRVEGYAPVARMHEKLISNETLTTIADRHRKTVPQVILRWNYQHSIPTIPKTSNSGRLRENINIYDFALSDEEMASIDSLNIDFRIRFDPDNCDFSKL